MRCYKFPFFSGDYIECLVHHGPVTRLKVSLDDNTLFSAGEDGTLFILEIKSKDIKPKRVGDNPLYVDSDQILVSKSEIEERADQLEKIKIKYDELALHHEYQIKLKEMNHSEKLKDTKSNFNHQVGLLQKGDIQG